CCHTSRTWDVGTHLHRARLQRALLADHLRLVRGQRLSSNASRLLACGRRCSDFECACRTLLSCETLEQSQSSELAGGQRSNHRGVNPTCRLRLRSSSRDNFRRRTSLQRLDRYSSTTVTAPPD